jgi:hypothetical protein
MNFFSLIKLVSPIHNFQELKRKKIAIGLLKTSCLMLVASPALAQNSFYVAPMYTPDFVMEQSQWTNMQMEFKRQFRQDAKKSETESSKPSTSESKPSTSKPINSNTTGISTHQSNKSPADSSYKPDSKITAQIKGDVLDFMVKESKKRGKHTNELEAKLRAEFAKLNINEVWQPEATKNGLKTEDIVTAITTFTLVGAQVLNDVEEVNKAQVQGTYQKFKPTASILNKLSNAERQRYAEALYWTAYINTIDYQNAKNGTSGYTKENVKTSVSQSIKHLTPLDPDRLALGANGLILK